MADLAVLQSRLDQAELALHRLMTGSQSEHVEHADMRVAYTRADVSKLQSYIASLKSQIALAGVDVPGLRRRPFIIES